MKLKLPLILGAALIVSFTAAAYASSPVATLKSQANIHSDIVKLGDLIDNAGPASAIPVFHAPDFGTTGTIQSHRVIEAARANGILLVDTRGLNEVVVSRAGRTVTVSEIERAVAEAVAKQIGRGSANDFAANFGNTMRPFLIEGSSSEAPRMSQFSYDARTQRFSGTVEVADSAMLRKSPVNVSGTIVETSEVVTLARAVDRGETIRESDIVVERRPRSETGSDAISTLENAVGQAAKRALRAAQILRPADLMKPDLVQRNETVTIVFEAGGVTLTMRGKAMAAGAEGEMISVLNPQSKRVLQGTVSRPGVVVVSRGGFGNDTTASIR